MTLATNHTETVPWSWDVVRDSTGTAWLRNGDGSWRTANGRYEATTTELACDPSLVDLTDRVDWALGNTL